MAIVQNVEITLVNGHYNKKVACLETREGCPITPGSNLSKTFCLLPNLNGNKDVRGIALDGYMKVRKCTVSATRTNNENVFAF